jgi:hypothetical protein
MVGSVDLQSTHESTVNDLTGLWAYLQQIVGQPFLFFRVSYGEELTLHLGSPLEASSAKLRRRTFGSYVLTFRGSIWSLHHGAQPVLTLAHPQLQPGTVHGRQIDLVELERDSPIKPGTLVESAQPSLSDAGGFALRVVFSDRTLLRLQPSPSLQPVTDGLPEIADWELFTPYARYLRVGPGPTWAYLPSESEDETL